MKYIIFLFLIILLMGCENTVQEVGITEKTNVYFCGGQSNAKEIWYETIKNEILKIDPEAIILWNHHPGSSIFEWFDKYPNENYFDDLSIIKNGIYSVEYDIVAFFWFQGESDYIGTRPEQYSDRFLGMINQYKNDLNDTDIDIYMNIVSSGVFDCEKIRNIQIDLISKNSFIYGIDTKDYERSDEWHLIPSELIRAGNGIANLYIRNNP